MGRAHGENPFELRKRLKEMNWNNVGVARQGRELERAIEEIEELACASARMKVVGGSIYNMMYTVALDMRNLIDVSRMVAASALLREETRGAHFRQDFPEQRDDYGLFNTHLRRGADGRPELEKEPVVFRYKTKEECQNFGRQPVLAGAAKEDE